ncbi:MAG: hypothetical protein ING59_04530 [Burkholderiales bacterium]|nr:hypothetical protein [Burkholderiales bacterium]
MLWQRVDTEPLDIDTGVTPASARAIASALLRRAVPLLVRRDGRVEPLATATLYRIAGRVVLVTCRHIFEDGTATLGDLAIPLPAMHRLCWLARCARRVMVHPQRDLALVELASSAARDALLRAWQPVPIEADALDATDDLAASVYVLAGWPYAQMRRVDEIVYARPVVVFAGRRALASGAAGDAAALRLAYSRVARRTDGIDVHAPELDGVSGATVWEIRGLLDGATACVLRPAAIQCAFKHDAYTRAEPIGQARDLMKRVR